MPTNRARKTRKKTGPLTDGERSVLLYGRPYPKKGKAWPDGSSWVRPYMLVSPGGQDDLEELWRAHKDELLAAWTGPGLPWALREFRIG